MGKHKRIHTDDAKPAEGDSLDFAEESAREALALANAQLEQGNAPTQVLREIAGLAGKLVTISAERRAREKARVYTLKTISRAVVIAWLREQSSDERERIGREVAAMNAGGSVLG